MNNLSEHDWMKTWVVTNWDGVKAHASHLTRKLVTPHYFHHGFGLAIVCMVNNCGHCSGIVHALVREDFVNVKKRLNIGRFSYLKNYSL